MDPRFVPDRAATERDRVGHPDLEPVLPSRQAALDECRRALRRGRGPVLLTGEAGSGKTWLWRRLADAAPGPARWLGIDASPSDDGLALVRRALAGLGRPDAACSSDPRAALLGELHEQSEDGRRWVLVLDEAQNAPDVALEEFRLLSNRLGRPDGFAGLLLVGRTGLALRLRARAWESLESRLAAHVRLGPIDAEEAGTLVSRAFPDQSWGRGLVEMLHVRSLGTPARLIRLADRAAARAEPTTAAPPAPSPPAPAALRAEPAPPEPPRPAPVADRPGSTRIDPGRSAPRLGEARPPLRFEDGLIEVGWEGVEEPAEALSMPAAGLGVDLLDGPAAAPRASTAPAGPIGPSTEAIDDPYAAIQARSEWSIAVEAVGRGDEPDAADDDEPATIGAAGGDDAGARRPGQVRAETGQEFAPYSRLFSQLNSSSDAE